MFWESFARFFFGGAKTGAITGMCIAISLVIFVYVLLVIDILENDDSVAWRSSQFEMFVDATGYGFFGGGAATLIAAAVGYGIGGVFGVLNFVAYLVMPFAGLQFPLHKRLFAIFCGVVSGLIMLTVLRLGYDESSNWATDLITAGLMVLVFALSVWRVPKVIDSLHPADVAASA
jgi:hypothetical protein